jgi:hypothetical protein
MKCVPHLTVIAALVFMALRPAHAMQFDASACGRTIPDRCYKDRETYYACIEKCHARKGTKPRWEQPK